MPMSVCTTRGCLSKRWCCSAELRRIIPYDLARVPKRDTYRERAPYLSQSAHSKQQEQVESSIFCGFGLQQVHSPTTTPALFEVARSDLAVWTPYPSFPHLTPSKGHLAHVDTSSNRAYACRSGG